MYIYEPVYLYGLFASIIYMYMYVHLVHGHIPTSSMNEMSDSQGLVCLVQGLLPTRYILYSCIPFYICQN